MDRRDVIELNNWRRQTNEGDTRNGTLELLGLRKWKMAVIFFGIFSILSLTMTAILSSKVFATKIDKVSIASENIFEKIALSFFQNLTENRIQSLYNHAELTHVNLTNELANIQVEKAKMDATLNDLTSNIIRLKLKVATSDNNTRGRLQKVQQDIGWIPIFNGYEYLVRRNGATFNQSRSYCRRKGGDLATVGLRSNTTRKHIAENIIATKTRFSTWIGLNDATQEGVWLWIDGQRATTKNTNFIPGEPNNFGENQDCAYLHKSPSGYQMGDFDCDSLLSSLCERRTVYD